MPVYEVDVPGKGTFTVNSRRPLSDEQAYAAVLEQLNAPPPAAPAGPAPEAGLPAALKKGLEGFASSYQTGLTAPFGAEEAAAAGLARQEALGGKYAQQTGFDRVKQAYQERGLFPAAGEVARQVPYYLAENLPVIGTSLAGARIGATAGAPLGPVGAIVGGIGGAALANLPLFAGSNVERQYETQKATGETPDISLARAYGTAAAQSALEAGGTAFALGKTVIGKVLGTSVDDLVARGGAESVRAAERGLLNTVTRGAVRGAAAEIPVEVSQQILERAQAGLPLLDEEAISEYGEAAYGATLLGGSLGPAGSLVSRSAARKKIAGEKTEQARLQEEINQAERKQKSSSPEYRQELNDQIYTLKDELAQIEPIAKDKTQDKDVRDEAIARAKEIKDELKDLQTKFKESMKESGLAPTLAQAKAAGFRDMPVVDEFGNVVKPKTKPLTEEEYGQKLEGAAKQWDETREKIFALTEKEEREDTAKQIVEQELAQNQPFIKSMTPDGRAVPFISYSFDLGKAAKPKNISADVWNASTLEQKTDMLKKERVRQYASLLEDPQAFKDIQDAQMEAERQKLNLFLEDEASKDQTAAEIAKRKSRDEAVQDIAEFQVTKAREQLGLGVLFLGPIRQRRLENAVNQGVVDRYAAMALEIKGLGGRKRSVAEAMPNIQEAINTLESERRSLTGKDIINPEGGLTPDGIRLVQIDTKLEEIKRLLTAGAPEQKTATEQALAGRAIVDAERREDEAVPVEKNLPSVAYENRIKKANQKAGGAFLDLTSYVDDLSAKRYIGGAKGNIQDTTKQLLLKNVDASKKEVIDNILEEIATARVARKLRPLSKAEAVSVAMDIDGLIDMLVTRSLAPAPGMVTETEVIPAQMRGTKIVAGAQEVERDVRGTRELPFGATTEKAELLSSKGQADIAQKFKELRATEQEISARVEALDTQMAKIEEPSDSDQAQQLNNARAEALDSLRGAQAETARYKKQLQDTMSSAGLSAKQALQTVKNVIRSIKQDTIAEGKRSVSSQRPLLKAQYATAPTDLIKDLDRVLRMENLQPDVANTLEQARRRLEEGGASAELEELVEEQVGRILRGTDKPFTVAEFYSRDVTRPAGRRAMEARADVGAALLNEIKTQLQIDSETAQFTGEQMTTVPQGRKFREERVQPDLFPETVATERATPSQFQRLQKSGAVQKEKARIEAGKAEAQRAKEEEQAKAKQAAKEAQRKAREKALIKAETTPARQELAQMNSVRNVLSEVISEYRGAKQAKIVEKNKQRQFLMKSIRTRAIKRLGEITNVASQRRYIKDVEEDLAFHFPKEAKLLRQLNKEIADLEKEQTDRLATLDQRVQNEVKFLKTLEKRVDLAKQGTPEYRKAQKQAAIVRGQLVKAKQTIKEAKEIAATRESEQAALRKLGLGLPGISVKAERRELSKGKRIVRRSKVVPVLSKEEIALRVAERKADLANLDRPLTKPEVTDAFKKIERLTSGQRTTQTKLYLEAAADAERAKTQLENYIENLKGQEPNKKRIVDLRNEVDETNKIVRELNRRIASEIGATYRGVEEAAIPIRKATTRGPVGGEVPFYDKKFTSEQLRRMSGLGLNAFEGGKSYSVDDVVDFRIGDTEGGGIDLEEANKRMDAVEKKLPKDIKFKYFPTMKSVTLDILNSMERQGVDVYETRIRGGVKPDGTVFIIGENHSDMADLEKTIAHEFVGHYTFEGMLGEDGMLKFMLKIDKDFATKDNESGLEVLAKQLGVLDDYAEAVASAHKFYSSALIDGKISEKEVRRAAKTKGLREIIAYTMEKRVDQDFLAKAKRWIQELVGAMRKFFKDIGLETLANPVLRKVGLKDLSGISTSDLFYMMKQANKSFEEGKPIAYKKANGDIDFAISKSKYNAGLEDLGQIASKVVGGQKGTLDKIKANLSGLNRRVQFVDRFAALEEVMKRGLSSGIIDSLKAADVMYFSRMADQRHSFTAEIANNGTLKIKEVKRPDGKVEQVIESERGANLKDISQALIGANVGNAKATGDLFTLYLAAERAERVGLKKLNFEGTISEADLKKALDFGRNNAAFQKARDLYNEYNRGLIDFAVQTGAISKTEGARFSKTNDYIPFYRVKNGVAELIIGSENPIRIGDLKNQPYLQELIGGKEAIMDFFTSSLQNTTLLTDMALRNMATYKTANALQDLGILKANKEKKGIRKGTGPASVDTIRFKYNGEDYHAVVDTEAKKDMFGDIPSELIVTGMEGIKVLVPGVVRGLALPANILRKFITRDPRYALRQIFRDSLAAALTTGANIKPVVDTMGEIKNMFSGESEAFRKLQARGVLGGQVITGAPEDMQKIMLQLASGKTGWELAMAKLDELAMLGDAGTRMAMYNSFLKQGLSEREATLAALESMNFGRRGVSPSMYYLNAMVPFFNAGVQGIDVLQRAIRGKMPYEEQLRVKQKLFARGALMAAFTMAYAAFMQDDEAYKNATPEQRYSNWFIRIPGIAEPFKIPIPFEAGLLFKSLPEGIYNAAFSDEKGSKIAKDLAKQLVRSLPGNPAEAGLPVPTGLKPFIETALNTSFFTGRDIVDARFERVEKKFQYTDKTPEVLKILAPVTSLVGLSPVQMENLIRGFTGSMGMGILSTADFALKPVGEAGPVAGRVSQLPLVGGLFQPNDAGRIITEAYDAMSEVQKRHGSYKKLIEDGRREEAADYLKENMAEISLSSAAGQFRQRMGEMTKYERYIKGVPEKQMSPDKKREELDKIRKMKIDYAAQFKRVREQTERRTSP